MVVFLILPLEFGLITELRNCQEKLLDKIVKMSYGIDMPLPDYLKIQGRRRALPARRPSASLLTPPWTLSQLEDVRVLRPASGDGIFFDKGTNLWYNQQFYMSWTARAAAEANGWQGVTYGNGLFVAIAYSGTNRVMTSPDGITWTARAAAEANDWQGVTYGNGLFVAIAYSGTNRVMTSPDGITWTARAAAEANSWSAVTYGNGLFVAIAYSGTNRVMTSGKSERNVIPITRQNHITDADGTLAHITTQLNALLKELETYGILNDS